MAKRPFLALAIFIAAPVLGLVFNFFFLWRVPGISLFLFTLITLVAVEVVHYVRERKYKFRKAQLLYLLVLTIAIVPFLTQNYVLSTFAVLLVLMTGIYTILINTWDLNGNTFSFSGMLLLPMFHQLTQVIFVFKPIVDIFSLNKKEILTTTNTKLIVKVLLGLMLAFPILLCFFILFGSADPAFGKIFAIDLTAILNLFSFERIWEIVIWFFVTCWIFAGLASALYYKYDLKFNLAKKNLIDPVIASVVVGLMNVLFLCFVIIQIIYLFTNQKAITEFGMTYAEYARQGFFELVIVASISLSVVYFVAQYSRFRDSAYNMILKFILSLQLLLTLTVLASAYYRTTLYQSVYGLTDTRLFVFAFLIFLAIVIVYFIVAVWWNRFMNFSSLIIFTVAVAFMLGLAIINPDAYVAQYNIAKHQAGELETELDVDYLMSYLSSDGYSQLLRHDEFLKDNYVMCNIARSWMVETSHRSSFQEANLYRLLNASFVESKLDNYIDEDELASTCIYVKPSSTIYD